MNQPSSPPASRWADLGPRVVSGLAMVFVAAIEIQLGGPLFSLTICLLSALMIWELSRMAQLSRAEIPPALGLLAAGCLWFWEIYGDRGWGWGMGWDWGLLILALPGLAILLLAGRDRLVLALYGLAILVAGSGFLELRAEGMGLFLWLVLLVVVSDILGYFVGRLVGGPKFWPAISPKKTWSGTVAGWLGALLVGFGFALAGWPWALVWLSPLLGFAGQMGDIAESALKRRAGIKDSSQLIPGHGGVLDRFDALLGAVLALMLLRLLPGGAF